MSFLWKGHAFGMPDKKNRRLHYVFLVRFPCKSNSEKKTITERVDFGKGPLASRKHERKGDHDVTVLCCGRQCRDIK